MKSMVKKLFGVLFLLVVPGAIIAWFFFALLTKQKARKFLQ